MRFRELVYKPYLIEFRDTSGMTICYGNGGVYITIFDSFEMWSHDKPLFYLL